MEGAQPKGAQPSFLLYSKGFILKDGAQAPFYHSAPSCECLFSVLLITHPQPSGGPLLPSPAKLRCMPRCCCRCCQSSAHSRAMFTKSLLLQFLILLSWMALLGAPNDEQGKGALPQEVCLAKTSKPWRAWRLVAMSPATLLVGTISFLNHAALTHSSWQHWVAHPKEVRCSC